MLASIRPHLLAASAAPPPDGMRRAAVALLVDEGLDVLFIRRPERVGDPWSGHVALPGGRHEPVDGDLLATAIRETHEEIGLDIRDLMVLGALPTLHPRSAGPHGIEVTPFLFRAVAPMAPRTGPEAERIFFAPLRVIASGELDGTFVYEGAGPRLELPCWRWDGFMIWGMTMRVVLDLIVVCRAAGLLPTR